MIHHIKRKELNVAKYDACIENSIQEKIYGFSWYLDIVADQWDVLVLDDYKAVMPIPWRKKMGISYIYPPFWLLELGVFSYEKDIDLEPFLEVLFKAYKLVELRLNTENSIGKTEDFFVAKQFQTLAMDEDYATIANGYRKDRRKDLSKAVKNHLSEKWHDAPQKLRTLFQENVGKRTPEIKAKDYGVLEQLMDVCIQKGVGEVLSVYDAHSNLVASGFLLKYKKTITILVSSTDFKNRKNGANTFLIDRAIFKYHQNFSTFNFGGSSMQSIANYFLSFGASTENYTQIKFNDLPGFVKYFKS